MFYKLSMFVGTLFFNVDLIVVMCLTCLGKRCAKILPFQSERVTIIAKVQYLNEQNVKQERYMVTYGTVHHYS